MLPDTQQNTQSNNSALGYMSLNQEVTLDNLPVKGTIPVWLTGSLLRNGPGKFDAGPDSFQHWFDGFAMLHRFSFHHGAVSYANKFLKSDSYQKAMKEGRITGSIFGSDPCKAVFKPSQSMIINANVSIDKLSSEFVALTETPIPVRFDPQTLETLGVVHYDDKLTGHHGCAHPHHDYKNNRVISYMTEFGMFNRFKVFAISNDRAHRELIGSYKVKRPFYSHSFGVTENYVVIAEAPYRVNPFELLKSARPFIENYRWRPQDGTTFKVMRKDNGRIAATFTASAFFCFHHINAFEQDGTIIVDLSAYDSPNIIHNLYLEQLRGNAAHVDSSVFSEFRRYQLPLNDYKKFQRQKIKVGYERLSEQGIELPTINYRGYNGLDYGVAYGVSTNKAHPDAVANQLIRVNVRERRTQVWLEEGCYPGEPIFVESPEAKAEDDGVILSLVLDAHKRTSFLLVLDAHTFQEIGRAEVPHHIPFGFHGQYYPDTAIKMS